jgi:hypothetical protein
LRLHQHYTELVRVFVQEYVKFREHSRVEGRRGLASVPREDGRHRVLELQRLHPRTQRLGVPEAGGAGPMVRIGAHGHFGSIRRAAAAHAWQRDACHAACVVRVQLQQQIVGCQHGRRTLHLQ